MNDLIWDYHSFRQRCSAEDTGAYISYGIRIIGTHRLSGFKVVRDIDDVSTEGRVVNALVVLCNALELEPCHLMDVIEGWIS